MKRRLAPILIAMMLLGALAASAQAQHHGRSLSVASGKAAIARSARTMTYALTSGGSGAPMSWEVFACGKRGADVICTAQWLTNEKCSVDMEAVPAKPAIRVRHLGKLQCAPRSGEE
jgi:hypothetical protein